jgi:hypothetical protein
VLPCYGADIHAALPYSASHLLQLRWGGSSRPPHAATSLRWHRDVEDNSVATASFDTTASQLLIESEVVIQQYNEDPLDLLVDEYALHFPFPYTSEDLVLLAPYRLPPRGVRAAG